MSSGFSANQYEDAFDSQRLQNWCQPKQFKERPTAKLGHTRFLVDDRGHLLPGFKQKDRLNSAFQGTWDLPARIPAPRICPTARSEQGLTRLQKWGFVTPRPDTVPTPGGSRRSPGAPLQTPEPAPLENTTQTGSPPPERPVTEGEREATPAPEPSPKPGSAPNTRCPETADRQHLQICQ